MSLWIRPSCAHATNRCSIRHGIVPPTELAGWYTTWCSAARSSIQARRAPVALRCDHPDSRQINFRTVERTCYGPDAVGDKGRVVGRVERVALIVVGLLAGCKSGSDTPPPGWWCIAASMNGQELSGCFRDKTMCDARKLQLGVAAPGDCEHSAKAACFSTISKMTQKADLEICAPTFAACEGYRLSVDAEHDASPCKPYD